MKQILLDRPDGPRRIWRDLDRSVYEERLEGALIGRMAGCTLGAPVEFWTIEEMRALAEANGDHFPPDHYWSELAPPDALRYGTSPLRGYTRSGMDGVPVDDDLAYTLLGLLILETFGPDFTTADVGCAWLDKLPFACTAEEVALKNLRKGVPAELCGERDNPYQEWIGASIRADPWGYVCPGWPERAAELAYRDAILSHRKEGVFGAMYFAAAIAAAFTVSDPNEALEIGLTEIPEQCQLSQAIRWALELAPQIHSHQDARMAVDELYTDMSPVHTINNACLTVLGINIAGSDLTRVIGETVAMGMDNDCNAATAGSIVGAVVGKGKISPHWSQHFNGVVHSYLSGNPQFAISDLVSRFSQQAERIHGA